MKIDINTTVLSEKMEINYKFISQKKFMTHKDVIRQTPTL